ncbi:DegV family protein [Mycoplasmopsis cynos]|nr:DegV family protein [Mycoplasmopsis cynos]
MDILIIDAYVFVIITFMRKLGIIIDPFSRLNEQKANELGYKFLPLQVEIDGKTYLDGTDDRLEILKMIDKSERVLSSFWS